MESQIVVAMRHIAGQPKHGQKSTQEKRNEPVPGARGGERGLTP